ncbi:copper amine oxidase N-terminal domain-containing protein [Paenibacillus sp. 1P07SE]|uniref:copper amine oxidase N-terminal domain-containing protein n=1 Tax=Paenibacillus sp. 1P07SE TaxID=3132209 RepID=UPI0039A6881B
MKRNVKKGLTSLLSVSVLSLSAASIISASPADVRPISAPIQVPAQQDILPISAEAGDEIASYQAVYGVVTKVEPYRDIPDTLLVSLEVEDGETVNFVVNEKTFLVDDLEPAVGQQLVGFYDTAKPVIMIYPPQYGAEVLAEVQEDVNYMTDRFNSDLLSADGTLKLNVTDETEIVNEDGTPFEGELGNRVLLVTYTIATLSLPAQTTPTHIVVLEPDEVTAPPTDIDVDEPLGSDDEALEPAVPISDVIGDVSGHDLVVGDLIIDAPAAYLDEQDNVMVPLRAIVESLGLELKWNAADKSIVIDEDISLKIGENRYGNSANDAIELGAAPVIVEGNTYVPLSFFKEVAGLNNAYVFEGQIVINNNDPIE